MVRWNHTAYQGITTMTNRTELIATARDISFADEDGLENEEAIALAIWMLLDDQHDGGDHIGILCELWNLLNELGYETDELNPMRAAITDAAENA